MKTTAENKARKLLVWALDPFAEECEPTSAELHAMAKWIGPQGLKIQPVYVFTPTSAELTADLGSMTDRVHRRLREFAASMDLDCFLPGEVLANDEGTRQGAVNCLLRHVAEQGARWIALSTHGRKGLERLVLGSFAEGVLREARCPVLFLSGKEVDTSKGRPPVAFFATDFSEASHRAYQIFLKGTAAAKAKAVLFHAIVSPPSLATGSGLYIPEDFFSLQEEAIRKKGAAWLEEAAKLGIPAELEIRDGGMSVPTGESIIAAAKEFHASIIAMASTSSLTTRLLLGSAAFETFRVRKMPVLVYGPRLLAEGLAVKD